MIFMDRIKTFFRTLIYSRYNVSFSKSGEDIQLYKLFNRSGGQYLDIGCFEPVTFSNSYFFYLRGWNGFVVDPNPQFQTKFTKVRPKDKFINRGISSHSGVLTYFMLPQKMSSMNTFDYNFLVKNNLESYIEKEVKVPMSSLEELIDEFKLGNSIDFLDVDVEGMDYEVLVNNNWEKFRPSVIVVETDKELAHDLHSDITHLLEDKEYKLLAKMVQCTNGSGNLIFCRKDYKIYPVK